VKTIVVELSADSCKNALKELGAYKRQIDPKIKEVCKRLAEIGRDEAQRRFDEAGEGNGGVRVDVVPTEGGWKIVASGKDVYFIEFGTGDDVDRHYDVSVPVFSGAWSMEHAQRYATNGYWYYRKERLTGTPAYMPMYYAEKAIRANEERVAQEVFGR
jgi:hypothetical protein